MSDLLQEMETTLTHLTEVGKRADELEGRAEVLRKRVETDRSAFETRSRNVVPQAQALIARLGRTQGDLQTAYETLTSKIKDYRQSLTDLHSSCSQETSDLLLSVEAVQIHHDSLRLSVEELQGETATAVFDHGVGAQTGIQSIPPGVDTLDAHLREQVLPSALFAAQEVVRLSDAIGREVHQTVVPALAQKTQGLQTRLQTGADDISKKATKLAKDLDNKSRELMQAAKKAAQDMHDRSNGRLIRLVGEVDLSGKALKRLIKAANRVLSGLHGARRKAMGILKTIVSIVDSLLVLLDKIVRGVKIA